LITFVSSFREISATREEEFSHKGYQKRYFFPHKLYYIPKCGPDGFELTKRMCNFNDLNQLWEVVLYAGSPLIDEFPEELFFDDDIIWHQQQFGKVGQVATVNLVIIGNSLYTNLHISDLVQRISRREELKQRIRTKFKGWNHMLLNSILNFAVENNLQNIYLPTADLAMEHTDPRRKNQLKRDLFDIVYHRDVSMHFKAEKISNWWVVDVHENINKLVIPEKKEEIIKNNGKIICILHDTERGLGHLGIDFPLADFASQNAPKALKEMLQIEKEMNVKVTYNVVGSFLNEVRARIEQDGHCIAFHSYDHQIIPIDNPSDRSLFSNLYKKIVRKVHRRLFRRPQIRYTDQLYECRRVDYRIKGYRPPQSKLTVDLNDNYLCAYNFEWLASSAGSLGITSPQLQNRLVKIPILFDDYGLYKTKATYESWEAEAITLIRQNDFIAIGLHDCYAQYWLSHYRQFLEKIRLLGEFKTFNQIADQIFLANAF
jgi:hypothetical protein